LQDALHLVATLIEDEVIEFAGSVGKELDFGIHYTSEESRRAGGKNPHWWLAGSLGDKMIALERDGERELRGDLVDANIASESSDRY
jgi:hypothetical protein